MLRVQSAERNRRNKSMAQQNGSRRHFGMPDGRSQQSETDEKRMKNGRTFQKWIHQPSRDQPAPMALTWPINSNVTTLIQLHISVLTGSIGHLRVTRSIVIGAYSASILKYPMELELGQ